MNRLKKWVQSIKKVFVSKEYRIDMMMWEVKYKILFFHIWKYMAFKNGKTVGFWRLRRYDKHRAMIAVFQPLKPIKIGKKEFEEKYKNNKWLVPVSKELDLNLP